MRTLLLLAFLAACGGSDVGPITVNDDEPTEAPPPEHAGGGDDLVVGSDACESDADCVPAECCHPSACVAAINSPVCDQMMCTQDCRYGTLDCGGGCLCHEGLCAARLSEAPAAVREAME